MILKEMLIAVCAVMPMDLMNDRDVEVFTTCYFKVEECVKKKRNATQECLIEHIQGLNFEKKLLEVEMEGMRKEK